MLSSHNKNSMQETAPEEYKPIPDNTEIKTKMKISKEEQSLIETISILSTSNFPKASFKRIKRPKAKKSYSLSNRSKAILGLCYAVSGLFICFVLLTIEFEKTMLENNACILANVVELKSLTCAEQRDMCTLRYVYGCATYDESECAVIGNADC